MKLIFDLIIKALASKPLVSDYIKVFTHTSNNGRKYLYVVYTDKVVRIWCYNFMGKVSINLTADGHTSVIEGKYFNKLVETLENNEEVQAQIAEVKETY